MERPICASFHPSRASQRSLDLDVYVGGFGDVFFSFFLLSNGGNPGFCPKHVARCMVQFAG